MFYRYTGDGTPAPCTVFGQTFEVGKWSDDLTLPKAQADKLAGNPMFETSAKKPAKDQAEA